MTDSKSLVLGIDTGGTYTDGVLLEYESRRVLASFKSLTTKHDLTIGIEAVIRGIRLEAPSAIKMVSISTTLATNAIAESKGKQVALLFLGYDPELIATFKMEGHFATPYYYYFAGGHDLYGQEQAPLDLAAILAKVDEIKDRVDAIAISGYFSPLNPAHENQAYEAIAARCDLPIVLGHQLSTKLGSVERATTAALNASLLAVLQDFVSAVRQALKRRQIDAPLMVVRGDGTLMSDEFAARTPVETIHSGPAASAIGGRFLSGLDEALVVDVGGTTTDIALVQGGQVAISEAGATVNGYKTAVKAANLHTIALGGDSHITLTRTEHLLLGPERVVPLAYLADRYPGVRRDLRSLSSLLSTELTPQWLEYWFLLREPDQGKRRLETANQRALVEFLRQAGPQPVPRILKQLDLFHVLQIGVEALVRREIIGKAGLTPTDLLHVEGRYTPWDVEAASMALAGFSRLWFQNRQVGQISPQEELRRQVWTRMTEAIVRAIVTFLSGKSLQPPSLPGSGDMGWWFFNNSLYETHPLLATQIRLRLPIIGIGAPAGILLKDVAEALHTELVLPEHYHVANAVGAVAGSVVAQEEILVYPRLSSEGLEVIGYYVQNSDGRQEFQKAAEALAHARAVSRDGALKAALRSGADDPEVIIEERSDGMDTYRILAKAVGSPRLAR
jgi:N-methylhydantoinase A/oxoprolinase/acetone carboxylase beta subunit